MNPSVPLCEILTRSVAPDRILAHHSGFVVSAIALIISLPLTATAQGVDSREYLTGRWQGTLLYDSLNIPFPLGWSRTPERNLQLSLYNGTDSITSTAVRIVTRASNRDRPSEYRDSVVVEFAHLASVLRGTIGERGFNGWFINSRKHDSVAVEAIPGNPSGASMRVSKPQASSQNVADAASTHDIPNISGTWVFPVESAKGERAWRFVATQSGDSVTATILRVDGDAGAHVGVYSRGEFRLSHFDGTRPGRLDVSPNSDGSIAIIQRLPGRRPRSFIGWRLDEARSRGVAEPTDVSQYTSMKDATEPFRFSFPDTSGKIISSLDERFFGKVVVVNVTGTWCPNCHDEAPFLSRLYSRYRDRGLEIVALDFEEPEELESQSRLKAFMNKYRIQYTWLLAGEPKEATVKLPQVDNLNTWPATFFIGRDGTVRAVRTGFAAKASGIHHDAMKADYEEIVERLLSERHTSNESGRRW